MLIYSIRKLDELPQKAKEFLEQEKALVVTHKLELKYDYWTAGQFSVIFKSVRS